jgi:hypothetical protein
VVAAIIRGDPVDSETLRTREVRETESSHKSPGRLSRAEARTESVMMQRWLNEAPKDQPFSSVGYHAKNDKKPQ